MTDRKTAIQAAGKEASLYFPDGPGRPLVLLNGYEGDGSAIAQAVRKADCGDCGLLAVSGIDWNEELSPWECTAVFRGEPPFSGGADTYLRELLDGILPEALRLLPFSPSYVCIAGYSLAGLFSLYALYRTDRFSRAASCSGSLWWICRIRGKPSDEEDAGQAVFFARGQGSRDEEPADENRRRKHGRARPIFSRQGDRHCVRMESGQPFQRPGTADREGDRRADFGILRGSERTIRLQENRPCVTAEKPVLPMFPISATDGQCGR